MKIIVTFRDDKLGTTSGLWKEPELGYISLDGVRFKELLVHQKLGELQQAIEERLEGRVDGP